ncbi:DUF885 domain-containing protein [[Mycoplasma] falconis]|uniref:DUF885 domain-containing protein n=1 Tax=[Mycoplasma] falconis TaxID=92403 RepID=A0A501XAN2_9BACT|nr:DUF885 family protein [[Mycoplasma] falconis]TPE57413.1 DUF885 domain-containing protein [[Mycoplasma] falconis]
MAKKINKGAAFVGGAAGAMIGALGLGLVLGFTALDNKTVEIRYDQEAAKEKLASEMKASDFAVVGSALTKYEVVKTQADDAEGTLDLYVKNLKTNQVEKHTLEGFKVDPEAVEVREKANQWNELFNTRKDLRTAYSQKVTMYRKLASKKDLTEQEQKAKKTLEDEINNYYRPEISKIEKEIKALNLDDVLLSKPGKKSESELKYVAQYIKNVKDEFDKDLAKKGYPDNIYALAVSDEDAQKILESVDNLIAKLEIINNDNLNNDSFVWKESLLYNAKLLKQDWEAGTRILNSWGLNSGTQFPLEAFNSTMTILNDKNIDIYAGQISNLKDVPLKWIKNYETAIENNFVPSLQIIKMNIRSILNNVYGSKLVEFVKSEKDSITVKELIGVDESVSLSEANPKQRINAFYNFYATKMWNAAGGEGDLTLTKTNIESNPEVENILEVTADNQIVKLYGVGLTQQELEKNDIGYGFIKGNDKYSGQKLYEQLVKMSTTFDYTPQELYDKGYDLVKQSKEKYITIANLLADEIAGKNRIWTTTIKYDEDGSGAGQPEELTITIRDEKGNVDFNNFVKWLNSEMFFFGREGSSVYTQDFMNLLNSNENLASYKQNLQKNGYGRFAEESKKDEAYNSINYQEYWYGALSSIKAYLQFKDVATPNLLPYFGKQLNNFDFTAYPFKVRAEQGAGAYSPSTGTFSYNPDPYYTIPKWSLSSLTTHETVMGHHGQIDYAKQYAADVDGIKLNLGMSFTSYQEGWALFSELLAVPFGLYGTPDLSSNDYMAIPKSFDLAKGITSFFTTTDESKITDEMVNQIKDLHNGIYWQLATSINSETNEKAHAKKAVKIANMLQYLGAINESQFRNLRLAIDTSINYPVQGKEDLPGGASLAQARQFMLDNSAMSIDQIVVETRRYNVYPAQALAYLSGREKFVDALNLAINAKQMTKKEFFESSTFKENGVEIPFGNVVELFDLLLRNGAIPTDTVIKLTEKAYDIK